MTLLESLFLQQVGKGESIAGAFERAADAYEYFQKASKSVVQPKLTIGKPPTAFPAALDFPEFRQVWDEWVAYRRESKFSAWKPATVKAKLAELEAIGPVAAAEAIRRSISNGWKGIFPDKAGGAIDRTCNRCAGKGYTEVDADMGSRWNPETGQTERVMKRVACARCQSTGKF